MIRILLTLLLLTAPALADNLNTQLEDAGKEVTTKFMQPGQRFYHFATGTVSLDNAIGTDKCRTGLDIWFNPDFDGTNVTATYTLFSCPRSTASADYASECLPLNFSPEGGEADTNIMMADPYSLHLWNARVGFFGARFSAAPDS